MSLFRSHYICELLYRQGQPSNFVCRLGLNRSRNVNYMCFTTGSCLQRGNDTPSLPALLLTPSKRIGNSVFFSVPQLNPKRTYAKKKASRGDEIKSKKDGKASNSSTEEYDSKFLEKKHEDALDHFRTQITRLIARTGRISPVILDPIRVDIGTGKRVPIDSLAAISVSQGNLVLKIYESTNTNEIVKAIQNSHLSLNPVVDSEELLRIPIPQLTVDGRKDISKQANNARNAACSTMRKSAQDFKKRFPDDKTDIEKLTISKTNLVDKEYKDAEKKIMQD